MKEGRKMEEKVELKIVVDEEEIEANEFVQTVIGKVIAGAVSALKGVKEDWERIEVTVKRI